MSSLLADPYISPELVLVAPPEEAEAARAALPEVTDFYAWIASLRELVEPERVAVSHDDRLGFVVFTSVVCLAALAPLVLVIVGRLLLT